MTLHTTPAAIRKMITMCDIPTDILQRVTRYLSCVDLSALWRMSRHTRLRDKLQYGGVTFLDIPYGMYYFSHKKLLCKMLSSYTHVRELHWVDTMYQKKPHRCPVTSYAVDTVMHACAHMQCMPIMDYLQILRLEYMPHVFTQTLFAPLSICMDYDDCARNIVMPKSPQENVSLRHTSWIHHMFPRLTQLTITWWAIPEKFGKCCVRLPATLEYCHLEFTSRTPRKIDITNAAQLHTLIITQVDVDAREHGWDMHVLHGLSQCTNLHTLHLPWMSSSKSITWDAQHAMPPGIINLKLQEVRCDDVNPILQHILLLGLQSCDIHVLKLSNIANHHVSLLLPPTLTRFTVREMRLGEDSIDLSALVQCLGPLPATLTELHMPNITPTCIAHIPIHHLTNAFLHLSPDMIGRYRHFNLEALVQLRYLTLRMNHGYEPKVDFPLQLTHLRLIAIQQTANALQDHLADHPSLTHLDIHTYIPNFIEASYLPLTLSMSHILRHIPQRIVHFSCTHDDTVIQISDDVFHPYMIRCDVPSLHTLAITCTMFTTNNIKRTMYAPTHVFQTIPQSLRVFHVRYNAGRLQHAITAAHGEWMQAAQAHFAAHGVTMRTLFP